MEYRDFWSELFKRRRDLAPPGYEEAVAKTAELVKEKARLRALTAKQRKEEEDKKKKDKEKKIFFANTRKKIKTRKEEEDEGFGW